MLLNGEFQSSYKEDVINERYYMLRSYAKVSGGSVTVGRSWNFLAMSTASCSKKLMGHGIQRKDTLMEEADVDALSNRAG